ncbi:hypothetical protein H5410_048506 [Solanum commersonii]|uniref:Uncharacterized protein n=1 Tax=Solanum commersonii TaxID=4109 RepID=A0A9J5XLZ7_SOLCO|nr:hypothetical protein H5410_048506 [Solanum commersonii]
MNISILLRHSGIWVSEVKYESYKSDGIVVRQSISFLNLKAAISTELDIDVSRKSIEISYIVEGFQKKSDVFKVRYSIVNIRSNADRVLTKVQANLKTIDWGSIHRRPIVVVDGAYPAELTKGHLYQQAHLMGQVAYFHWHMVLWTKMMLMDMVLEQFKNAFGVKEMCVVSDRNESIMKSAYKNEDFDKLMAKVDKIDHGVKEYLEDAQRNSLYTKDTLGRRFEEVLIINASKSLKMEEKNVKDMHPYCSITTSLDALAKTYEIPMVPMRIRKIGHSR